MMTRRYRLKLATWTVVREPGAPSPRTLSSPTAVAELARDLLRDQDDDKEHFWAILLNAQNQYLLHTLVSIGTQSASLVHPREVLGPALREGAASVILVHNHPSGDPSPLARGFAPDAAARRRRETPGPRRARPPHRRERHRSLGVARRARAAVRPVARPPGRELVPAGRTAGRQRRRVGRRGNQLRRSPTASTHQR